MADTKRKRIVDAIITALEAAFRDSKVTQDLTTWAEANLDDMPLIFVEAQKPEVARLSYPQPSADDMEAEMTITLNYQTLSDYASNKRGAVDELMQDIEQTLVEDSAIAALVKDITLTEDEIDVGTEETRGFGAMIFMVTYHYNHITP